MSATEERALSEKIWKSRHQLEILLKQAQIPVLPQAPLSSEVSPDAKRRLSAERDARRILAGGGLSPDLGNSVAAELRRIDEATEALVRGNLRLVAWVAKRFVGRGLDLSDLFQEGAISLLEAVARFDPARGNRLSTYATRAIQLGIVRALAEKGRMIRIPLHRLGEVIEASSAWNKLRSSLERDPTESEVSSLSGIHPDQLSELAPALRPLLSTDACVPGTDLPYSEVLIDERLSPFERTASSEARTLVLEALASLPSRERSVLKLRYGIGGGLSDEQTFEAIGKAVGLSRERSRQIERNALQKMRAALRSATPRRSDLEGRAS